MSDGDVREDGLESRRPAYRQPFYWLAFFGICLGGLIYYPLFFPPSVQTTAIQGEEFFFEANEAAGAPVLVLSIWLFYRRSHYLDLLSRKGASKSALAVLMFSAALYGWGHLTSAPDLQLASAMGVLAGTALMLGGAAALRAFWLPIVFLVFALPLPPVLLSSVMFPIQLMTAEYAGMILNAIGVASVVRGDQILRPENTFIVIETCSGVRTIVTLAMLTVLLIDLFDRRGWHAFALMVLSPVIAFLTNGLRVVTLVLNPHSSIHSIHNLQGILMLLVGLTAIYLVDVLIERFAGTGQDATAPSVRSFGDVATPKSSGRSLRMGCVVAVLAVMFASSQWVPAWKTPSGLEEMPDELLTRVFGAQTRRVEPDYQFRGSARFLAHSTRLVRVGGETVEVFLGVANEQVRSHTALTPRLAWPRSGLTWVEGSTTSLGSAETQIEVRRVILTYGARKVLSYSWYPRAGSLVEEWLRNAAALDRSPLVRDQHMLAIRLSAHFGRGRRSLDQAERAIEQAWQRLAPELKGYAPTKAPQ